MENVTLNERYRLRRCIGSGGMAVVYEGVDMLLERRVAVKVLRQRFASDPEFLERFQREARAAANLDHPNIVTVFDVGRDDERHYIVMEYVDGHDLKTIIRQKGRLSVAEALDIATQVAAGVGHAHKAGVIHRDIKPQNVLLTHSGRAKVVDFGIARALSESGLTDSDTVWGSPIYFAPEQAAGDPPTPASDVYSIGVMMYEMLAGSPPFQAENPTALAMKHLREEPPPLTARNSQVPPRLEWIVRKVLSKEPSARYRTADQLARVLEDYRLDVEQPTGWQPAVISPPTPHPEEERAARREPETIQKKSFGSEALAWVLGVIALVAVVGLIPLWWLVYRSYAALPVAPLTATPTAAVTRTQEVAMVAVPNVVDRPVDEALSLLQRNGLEMDVLEEREALGKEEGIVIEQDPLSGEEAPIDSVVSVVVSGPGRELTMPDVVGRPVEEMEAGLESMGLQIVIKETWSSSPEGHVVAQQPEAEMTIRSGSTVTLTVSTGSNISLGVNLDRKILLNGAVLHQGSVKPGGMIGVTLRWQATRALDQRYVVFVHLIGPDGNLVAQDDREPHLPTTEWLEGISFVDPHQVTVPAGTPSGRYQIRTGMYPAGRPNDRLPVVDPGSTTQEANSILVAEIDVTT
ncbi:MAG: Stk1 family PASTA domain-containing Ser/Thr kinase [Chloroflexota bacterium]|nr:Stk1 family PASTA domain-containing Ser/Thr kinase [Chloroflexota bacterium]